jgi:hypothetical protein
LEDKKLITVDRSKAPYTNWIMNDPVEQWLNSFVQHLCV